MITKFKLIAVVFLVIFTGCIEYVTLEGVVIEHNTASDKWGSITYYTVVKTSDGYIKSLSGLEYYTVPVGSKVAFKETRFK